MNTAKEKKLNDIKSEILEITEFVTSNEKDEDTNIHVDKASYIDSGDTFTLTNIVDSKQKVEPKDDLAEIKNELYTLKSILTKQELVLKEILSKIKWTLIWF